MTLRNGHGTGAGQPRVEVLPADEQPPAAAAGAGPVIARDAAGRLSSSAAARALASLPRRGAFLPRDVATHPRFAVHNKRRVEWLRGRRAELAEAHGSISRGVGAILAAAGWCHAGAELAAELGAETLDLDLFKTAANLSAAARQHELAAWELASREAAAKATAAPVVDLGRALAAGGAST